MEWVESNEEMEDIVEMRMMKGKGKQKEVDEDYMEVNEPADSLSPVQPVSKRAQSQRLAMLWSNGVFHTCL